MNMAEIDQGIVAQVEAAVVAGNHVRVERLVIRSRWCMDDDHEPGPSTYFDPADTIRLNEVRARIQSFKEERINQPPKLIDFGP